MAYATVPPSASGGVDVEDDNVSVVTDASKIDFVDGTGFEFVVTDLGGGEVRVVGNATGGGGGGAPDNAQYLALIANATLTQERVFTPEAGVLEGTDSGAGAAYTLGIVTAGVSFAKIANGSARSLLGRAANSAGVHASIAGGGAGTFANDNATSVAFRAITDIIQNLNLSGDISPAQLTGDVNDYDPTSLSTSSVLRLDSDAARAITGLAGGADGRVLVLFNIGAFTITFTNASASSAAGNRFDFGADLALLTKHGAAFWYDSTSSRWRLLCRGFPFTAAPIVTLTAGAGMTGGGDTSANRTFDVVANADGSITVNANDIQVGILATDAQHGNRGGGALHADVVSGGASGFMTGADKALLDAAVPSARTVTAGAGLTGGGDLSANRTLDVAANADGTIVVNANDIQVGTLIAANVPSALITYAKIQNLDARSLLGRSANSSGVSASIAGGGANTFASDDASTLAFRVVTTIPQNFALAGDLTPAQITANQNDYDPTSLSTATVLRLDTDASRNITGLAGGADGRIIVLDNIGSFPIVLVDASASSAAGNRFDFGRTLTLLPKRSLTLKYDSTASRWRLANSGAEQTVNALTDGANITLNRDLGWQHAVTLGGNRTLDAPTGVIIDGMWTSLAVFQDGTGSRTLTLATGAGAFRATELSLSQTLSTAAGKCDYFIFRYNATDARHDLMDFRKAA